MENKIDLDEFIKMLNTSDHLLGQMQQNATKNYNATKKLPVNKSVISVHQKLGIRTKIKQYKALATYQKNISENKKKKIKISIIINDDLNLIKNTGECLVSVFSNSWKYGYEIFYMSKNPISNYANSGVKYIKKNTEECNNTQIKKAIDTANGEYIFLMNSGVRLLNGCLDVIADILDQNDDIGVVCGKVIREDGLLDEAGSIIFSNGIIKKFGNQKSINNYEYNYSRNIDVASPSYLALRKKDFLKLKDLDMKYQSIDYSILDLEFNMRYFLNKRIFFNQHSIVVKKEGRSLNAYNEDKNRFYKKWSRELKRDYHKVGTSELLASRHGRKRKLLIVDSIVPERDHDAGSLRMYQIIKSAMNLNYDVTLFPDSLVASQPYTGEYQKMGVEVVYGGSASLDIFYSNRINYYDDIILSRPNVAIKHLMYCKLYEQNAKLIYDTVDLHYLRIKGQGEKEKNKLLLQESKDWEKLEKYLMLNTDKTLVVSYTEKKLLESSKIDANICILSVINPIPYNLQKKEYGQRKGLMFIGDYSRDPNRSAVEWFVKEIMPIIKKQIPDIKLTLIGNNKNYIEYLESPNVSIKGYVENTASYFNNARLFVCPLLYGAGVKGKIAESISYGLPVISTSVGTEGMHLVNGLSCIEADSSEDFAKKVIETYNNEQLWNIIQKGGNKIYEKYFSEEAGKVALKEALSE